MKKLQIIFDEIHENYSKLLYVVIIARYKDNWVFVQHKDRNTWEIPGGHIESGENPDDAAKRELFEETGALDFTVTSFFDYNVKKDGAESWGRLYYADIFEIGELPDFEINNRCFVKKIPDRLTYPDIQSELFYKFLKQINYR